MNMMVNTSELVGSEAEIKRNSETALKRAVSKLVASWEKKQATRAKKIGGFGLLAVSLAACNSSSDDTTTTTTTTTPTTETTTPAAPTVNNVTLDAAVTNVFGTAGTNDVITATGTTLTGSHLIIDSDTTDSDSMTVAITGAYTATPTVVGIEDVRFNYSGTLVDSTQTLTINVDNITASGDSIHADVVSANSLVNRVDFINAKSNHFNTSDDFSDVRITTTADADTVVTVNNTDTTVRTITGAGDDLTINGGTLNDVTLAASTDTEDLVVTGKDLSITANAILGNVTLTAANDVSALSATSAIGDVNITAGNDVTGMSVTAAAGTVTVNAAGAITVTTATASPTIVLNNTGAKSDGTEGITITNADSATTATITSVGEIQATAGNGLAAATSITATAGTTSTITADGVTSADQVINLNADSSLQTTPGNTNITLNANQVETLNLGGTTAITVVMDADDLDTETVATTNTSSSTLRYDAMSAVGNAVDLSSVATTITQLLNYDATGDTLTVSEGAQMGINVAQAQTATPTFKHKTDATSGGTNSMTLSAVDLDTTDTDVDIDAAGLTFTDFNTLTIALGNMSFTSTQNLTGADLTSVVVTGSGTPVGGAGVATVNSFDMNDDVITGVTTSTTVADVTFDASGFAGNVLLRLDGTANSVENVQTGAGQDTIKISAAADSGNAFVVSTGAAVDQVTMAAASSLTYDGGAGVDKLVIDAGVDLSTSTLSLTSVEEISLVGGGLNTVAASYISGKSFIISIDSGAAADFVIAMDQATLDLSTLAFNSSTFQADDDVVVNGSAIGLAQTVTGSVADDTITGGAGNDIITGGVGADTLNGGNGVNTLSGGDGIDIITGGTGIDTITGGAGADIIIGGDAADIITGGEGADVIAAGKGANVITLTETTAAADDVVFGNETTLTGGADIAFGALGGATKITGFTAGAGGDELVFDVSAFGLATVTEYVGALTGLAVDSSEEIAILTGTGYATDDAAETAVAGRVTGGTLDMVVAYFNTTTNKSHVIHVSEANTDQADGTATLVCSLEDFTTQTLHDTLDANNVASFA